ncbi:MAG: exopolysaccharide biosynthesis polyprenyl glycosylphosphotransferase [Acidobacteriaceae bacterium]|nr:exopolysaccharide biosynthesis polyprenyl glycosylphosphotransferase [Acidobacteriaceae bacterium]
MLLTFASVLGATTYEFTTERPVFVNDALGVGLMASIIFLPVARSQGLYEIQAALIPSGHLKRLFGALAAVLLASLSVLFLLKSEETYSRGAMISFAALAFVLIPGWRLLGAQILASCMRSGVVRGRRIVTIGQASELDKLDPSNFTELGLEEIARVTLAPGEAGAGLTERGRRQVMHAINLARELHAAEFMLIIPWNCEEVLADTSELLRLSVLPVKLFPDFTIRTLISQQSERAFNPYVPVEIKREPLTIWERTAKRALDVVVATCGLVALSPFLLMIAVAIKLDSPGPVIFRQRRCGFDDREFVIFKFRTMTVHDDGNGIVQATRGDPRVTALGRVLRRSSIDELPQLINVIRGEMSLVGPRPHATAHDKHYRDLIASYALRHHVKPGLSGAAQVAGLRGATQSLAKMEKRVQADLWYIGNWSFMLDLKILARTALAVLGDEAY